MSLAVHARGGRGGADRTRPQGAPAVPDDEPPSTWQELLQEIRPRPGRVAKAARITAIAAIIITLCEAFRIPNASFAAYSAFFLFKSDADATIPQAIMGAFFIGLSVLLAIVIFAATLSEPALRIPAIALVAFGALYLSRATKLGVVVYAAGLFTVNALTQGDDLTKDALSTYNDSNITGPGLPSVLFETPEDTLVHNLLWLAFAISVASAVIVVVNRLTGPDPERKLRDGLADRLEAMAALCAGRQGARGRVADYARQGTAALTAQNAVAGKLKGGRYEPAFGENVIAAISDLLMLLLATGGLPPAIQRSAKLDDAAATLSATADAVRQAAKVATIAGPFSDFLLPPSDTTVTTPAGDALHAELKRRLESLVQAIDEPAQSRQAATPLFKPDAATNPEYAQFALKTTLALMLCYLFTNLADWSSINTCIVTCFVVALSSVGQSVHKMVLRVSGSLIGGALGFLAVLFIEPALTDIWQLLLVMTPVLFAGAWILVGGQRTNYAGQQVAWAFMLTTLQGFGPTEHFQTARDRVIGILVGEVVVTPIFIYLWPVSVGSVVRKQTGATLAQLAKALRQDDRAEGRRLLTSFANGIASLRSEISDQRYELRSSPSRPRGPRLDDTVLSRLQALVLPVSILNAGLDADDATEHNHIGIYRTAVADWIDRSARWMVSGSEGDTLARDLPAPPVGGQPAQSAAAVWCADLDRRLQAVLAATRIGGTARQDQRSRR